MKLIHLLLLLALPLASKAADHFDQKTLKEEMSRFISKTRPNRSVGSKGHAAAFKYLEEEFKKIAKPVGGKVYLHSFMPDVEFAAQTYQADLEAKVPKDNPDHPKWKNFTDNAITFVKKYKGREGKNLILELPGKTKPKEIIYVGAHYDTITHDHKTMKFTPDQATDGADDNASGVTALLSIARRLAGEPRVRTIRIVAFDYEEIFFLGSYALAKDIKENKLGGPEKATGLFNLEMVGWTSAKTENKPVVKLYARLPQTAGNVEDLKLAKHFSESVNKNGVPIQPTILQNGFDRSDNWSFWQKDLPAICISQDWESDFNEKNYHTSHDSAKNLNFGFLSAIARTTADAVLAAANEP